jgi:hypothetical protein
MMPSSSQGNEGLHGTLRAKVVEFMREHQDEYAPFVEDDEGWDKYIARMKKVCRCGTLLMGAHAFALHLAS